MKLRLIVGATAVLAATLVACGSDGSEPPFTVKLIGFNDYHGNLESPGTFGTTVGPFLRDLSSSINGIATGDFANFIQAQSVLTAGFVMGIMLIPYVSSLSDDIITAVPRALRDGSLGLGATKSETIKKVVMPAALPGVVGALLMTASRAIGETMIVVLAAGVAARMQLNPFEPMTTVTVKIVSQLTGDLEFTSPQTLVAFALGITLFVITLCLNIYALYIVRKYREQYE